jgi:hypothetical protein
MSGFESQHAAERQALEFLHAYRATFETFDVDRIVDCFVFPLQLTSDADQVAVVSVPTRGAWTEQISSLLASYRSIGVTSAYPVEIRVTLISPNVLLARVLWSLLRADQSTIYQFHASYTLVMLGDALRISAIVYDETLRLRAAVAQATSSSGR